MTETSELTVLVRECWNCGHLGVPVDGEGEPCVKCHGEYRDAVATTKHEVVADTEIINEWSEACASPEQADELPALAEYTRAGN